MSNTQPKPGPAGHPKPQKVKQPARAQQKQAENEEDEEEYEEESGKNQLLAMAPSWLFSFVSHLILILVLALWLLPPLAEKEISFQSGTESGEMSDSLDLDLDDTFDDELLEELEPAAIQTEIQKELTEVSTEVDLPATEVSDVGTEYSAEELTAPTEVAVSSANGNELSGRGADSRKQLAKKNGASAESEEAVDLALAWIVKHQLPNGSWNYDHTRGEGNFRQSEGAGTFSEAKNAATAMALLPLLGAGHTHVSGEYKEAVKKGFEFLKQAGERRGKDMYSYSEPEGRLYSHGLVTIALCECYAMTYDKELEPYAQGAINFTNYAQDPRGGGWRYVPQQRGDTSAVGWQLMALKSAKISGLATKPKTFRMCNQFLDSVSDSRGAVYGYETKPGRRVSPTLTSIGLLCRMYLGWKQDRPGLVDGMERIARIGPDTEYGIDMYYNYYATQAMKHMYTGQSEWKRWNIKMRDFLVSTQGRKGNERGSWHFASQNPNKQAANRWSVHGGRLYDTAMSCMTLEVYYRFLPLYDSQAVEEAFVLEE